MIYNAVFAFTLRSQTLAIHRTQVRLNEMETSPTAKFLAYLLQNTFLRPTWWAIQGWSAPSLRAVMPCDTITGCTLACLPSAAEERGRHVVDHQGPSCPWRVTSKPLRSECVCACPPCLQGAGLSGKFTVCAAAKRLLTLILSPTRHRLFCVFRVDRCGLTDYS